VLVFGCRLRVPCRVPSAHTDIGDLIVLIGGAINSQLSPVEYGELYERLRAERAVSVADELVGAVARSDLPPSGVGELGRRLAGTGRHAGAAKAGIAVVGVYAARSRTGICC
jgi:hypothetical protein